MDRDGSGSGSASTDSWLRRRPLAVDLLLATVLAALALPVALRLIWISDWHLPGRLALTAMVVLAHGGVALRRVRMTSAFAVVSVAMLALALAPPLGGAAAAQVGGDFAPILLPCSIAFPVMLYSVAAYGRGREPLLVLVVAMIGAMITASRLWDPGNWTTGVPTGNGWRLFILAALLAGVVAPWALGRFRGVHEAYVGTLEEQTRRAAQDRLDEAERATAMERSRIAREMHDVVAHSLSVMVSQAEGGRFAVQRDPVIAAPVFATIATTGREALTEMRGLLDVLSVEPPESSGRGSTGRGSTGRGSTGRGSTGRGSTGRGSTGRGSTSRGMPDRDGVESRSPQPSLADLDTLIERVRAAGTPVAFGEHGDRVDRGDLGRSGELTAYRVVQEALTNVVKHAGPGAQATIDLRWTSAGLTIEVRDNGPATLSSGNTGRGLTGMRERVDLLGGDLDVGPDTVGGYLVRARIPLVDKAIGSIPQ